MSENSNHQSTVPSIFYSISNSYKCRPANLPTSQSANLPDEYRSPSSPIGHLCIILVPTSWPANLPTYSPAHCFHFLLIEVRPDNLPNEYRSPSSSSEHFCIPIVPKYQPVDMLTYSPALSY